jgi:regulator of protease activity HflC (stomatin/prohibitin superfamily)
VVYKVAARAFPPDTQANENSAKYNLDLKTNDGQDIDVDLTIIYGLKSNEVAELHKQIGPNYEDQILLPQIRSEARIVVGSYMAEEIYKGKVRDSIQTEIKDKLAQVLAKYPAIQIQDALLRHFAFSPEFEKKIEEKKIAAQQIEINKNKALAQEEEAKRQEAEARGGKFKAVQEATGRAESAKIEADANRYKLEQEAMGQFAKLKAEAEGKRLLVDAMAGDGGKNVVALKWAENIPDKLQIWGIPTGSNSASFMDMSGLFGKMLTREEK